MANQNVLPLLAFQHHVGSLYIDANDIEFVTELGVGDLAIVEQGRWHRPGGGKPSVCSVVVKGYKPFVISSAVDFRELLLESSKLYRLTHPNITRFLGLGCFSHGSLAEVRGSMFMVEEYVGTRTLRKLIGEQMRCRLKNLYNMQTALRWAAEVASALAALHEQQPAYIHGDVKADNVFLTDAENLKRAIAKLGDLKPHRHVYDQEPSTLAQHQERLSAKHVQQSSLARFSLERSSCGSDTSWASRDGTSSSGAAMATPLAMQRKEHTASLRKCSSGPAGHDDYAWGEQVAANAGTDSTSSTGQGTLGCSAQRTQSMPVPIAARGGRLESVGSCPPAVELARHRSLEAAGGVLGTTSVFEVSRSMPMPPCLSASELAEVAESEATAAASGADAAAASEVGAAAAAAAAANEVGAARRRNRAICLSDSASSTASARSGSARAKPAVELVSLAAADDEEDEPDTAAGHLMRKVAAADDDSGASSRSSSPTARGEQQQQDCTCNTLQEAWDCSAHGGYKAATFMRAKSAPVMMQQAACCAEHLPQHREVCQLTTSFSASAVCGDGKVNLNNVHNGHCVNPLSASLSQTSGALETPFKQQSVPQQQQQQQQQLDSTYFGWELSPSGAASPCGAAHSVMLDLFADMADDEVLLTRRLRDQYTLVPGSFVQQRMPAGTQLLQPSRSWEPAFASTIGVASSSCSSQPALERACSLKGGAPSAIEAKQHGSNSAFAALTAIDCIREESSSIATDSVMGSCPPSRETSVHSGMHYYRDTRLSLSADKDQAASGSLHERSSGHLLGLSALLPLRSIASSGWNGDSDGTSSTVSEASTAVAIKDEGQVVAGSCEFSSGCVGSAVGPAQDSRSCSLEERMAALEALRSYESEHSPALLTHMNQGSRSSSGTDAQVAIECKSPVSAAASSAADVRNPNAVKRVRFTVERAAGTTPSRDISLLYAAPELINGHRPTEKVDVFAFGVVLYELLSRSSLISHCAAAVGHNHSRRGSKHGGRHGGRHSPRSSSVHMVAARDVDSPDASGDSEGPLPEQQLLLAYAQMVAGGYRPPIPAHFPAAVQNLISSCWSAEPHERPRMADVLTTLQSWSLDKQLVACLDSYLAGLADIGYGPRARRGPECSCGCVIC